MSRSEEERGDDGRGVTEETVEFEESRDWFRQHVADKPIVPNDDEDEIPPTPVDPSVAKHFKEMNEIGASVRGEGETP